MKAFHLEEQFDRCLTVYFEPFCPIIYGIMLNKQLLDCFWRLVYDLYRTLLQEDQITVMNVMFTGGDSHLDKIYNNVTDGKR